MIVVVVVVATVVGVATGVDDATPTTVVAVALPACIVAPNSVNTIGFAAAKVSFPVDIAIVPGGMVVDVLPGPDDSSAALMATVAAVGTTDTSLTTTLDAVESSDLRFRLLPGTDGLRGCFPPVDALLALLVPPVASSFFISPVVPAVPALWVALDFFFGPSDLPAFVLRDPFPPPPAVAWPRST